MVGRNRPAVPIDKGTNRAMSVQYGRHETTAELVRMAEKRDEERVALYTYGLIGGVLLLEIKGQQLLSRRHGDQR